jgi:hypothetical protein
MWILNHPLRIQGPPNHRCSLRYMNRSLGRATVACQSFDIQVALLGFGLLLIVGLAITFGHSTRMHSPTAIATAHQLSQLHGGVEVESSPRAAVVRSPLVKKHTARLAALTNVRHAAVGLERTVTGMQSQSDDRPPLSHKSNYLACCPALASSVAATQHTVDQLVRPPPLSPLPHPLHPTPPARGAVASRQTEHLRRRLHSTSNKW